MNNSKAILDTIEILEEAEQKFGIKKFYACVSGGKDSITSADVVDKLGKLTGVIFIDTTIGIQETKDFVVDLCKKRGWDLIILKPKVSYDEFVINKFGFPTARFHNVVMGFLKYHPLRRFVIEHKEEKIGLISGVRKFESNRRGRTMKPIIKDGSMIFVAPIFHLKTEEVWGYIKENNLEVSPVYRKLHLSGDCMCGAFSDIGEAELISMFYPEIAQRIRKLENLIKDKVRCILCGDVKIYKKKNKRRCPVRFTHKWRFFKYCKWGNQSSMSGAINQSRMDKFVCADCQISNSEVTNDGLPPTPEGVGIRPTIL